MPYSRCISHCIFVLGLTDKQESRWSTDAHLDHDIGCDEAVFIAFHSDGKKRRSTHKTESSQHSSTPANEVYIHVEHEDDTCHQVPRTVMKNSKSASESLHNKKPASTRLKFGKTNHMLVKVLMTSTPSFEERNPRPRFRKVAAECWGK